MSANGDKNNEVKLGIIYGVICLSALIILHFLPQSLTLLPYCPFRKITGYPCPACGSGRCLASMANADFVLSFLYNPLLFLVVIGCMTWGAISILCWLNHWEIKFDFHEKNEKLVRCLMITALLANWVYLCARYG